MPVAQFVHDGASLDYTPSADVAAGDVVVQGDLVGIAKRPILAGTPGALAAEGVFAFPKATDVAYGRGTILFWDVAAGIVSTAGGVNKPLGKVARAAATTDPTVYVRLSPQAQPGNLFYVNTAASSPIVNTTAETTFDKSVTVPGGSIQVGDVLRIGMALSVVSVSGMPNLTIRIKLGATAITVMPVTADFGVIVAVQMTLAFRAAGAAGQFIVANLTGNFVSSPISIDTTAPVPITVTAQWAVANASNSCRLDLLLVEKLSR